MSKVLVEASAKFLGESDSIYTKLSDKELIDIFKIASKNPGTVKFAAELGAEIAKRKLNVK